MKERLPSHDFGKNAPVAHASRRVSLTECIAQGDEIRQAAGLVVDGSLYAD